MNKVVRCHAITEPMAKQVMRISLEKINHALSGYYDGNLTAMMMPAYETMVLTKYKDTIMKIGARPIVRHMDSLSEKLGLAIHHE